MAMAQEIVWGALGVCVQAETFKRPMAWGPHGVGGAEAGPERLLK